MPAEFRGNLNSRRSMRRFMRWWRQTGSVQSSDGSYAADPSLQGDQFRVNHNHFYVSVEEFCEMMQEVAADAEDVAELEVFGAELN